MEQRTSGYAVVVLVISALLRSGHEFMFTEQRTSLCAEPLGNVDGTGDNKRKQVRKQNTDFHRDKSNRAVS